MDTMLDYAANYCGWEVDAFFGSFSMQNCSLTNLKTIAGKFGVKLYRCVTDALDRNLPEYV